jgi:hypothetical protein
MSKTEVLFSIKKEKKCFLPNGKKLGIRISNFVIYTIVENSPLSSLEKNIPLGLRN